MPRDMINFTARKNDTIHSPPSPLNRHAIVLQNKMDRQQNVTFKPKFSLCNPGKTNATALGFQPLSQSVVEGVEKFVFFVGYLRSGHSIIGSVMDVLVVRARPSLRL